MVSVSRIIVVVVNLIFMVFGVAVLALGGLFFAEWIEVRDAFEVNSTITSLDFKLQEAGDILAYTLLAIGCLIVILSLIGCIGGCCEVKFLLAVYSVVILCLLIVQIAMIAVIVVRADDASDDLDQGLRDALWGYREDSEGDKAKAWSRLFHDLKCCGVKNHTVEFNTTNFMMSPLRTNQQLTHRPILPVTCCRDYDYKDTLTKDIFQKTEINECLIQQTSDFAYTRDCFGEIDDRLDGNKSIMAGVGAAIFALQIFMIALGFYLCSRD